MGDTHERGCSQFGGGVVIDGRINNFQQLILGVDRAKQESATKSQLPLERSEVLEADPLKVLRGQLEGAYPAGYMGWPSGEFGQFSLSPDATLCGAAHLFEYLQKMVSI